MYRNLLTHCLLLLTLCLQPFPVFAITDGSYYRIRNVASNKYIATKQTTANDSRIYVEDFDATRWDQVWQATAVGTNYCLHNIYFKIGIDAAPTKGFPVLWGYDKNNVNQQLEISATGAGNGCNIVFTGKYLSYRTNDFALVWNTSSGNTTEFVFEEVTNLDEITRPETDFWEDETVFGINKEAGHATMIPFANTDELKADACFDKAWLQPTGSKRYITLNGTWNLYYVSTTSARPYNTEMANISSSTFAPTNWDQVLVPGCIEMYGYDEPIYVNVNYPFRDNPPYVTTNVNGVDKSPVATYQRTFELPSGWEDERVFFHSDGLYSAAFLWVNGKRVGYTQGGNNDAEFDITEYVHAGTNGISLQVFKWSDGSYLEGQDMWHMSGLHRDVYLYATPKTFVRDHYITTAFKSGNRSGTLKIAVEMDNRDKTEANKTLQVVVLDPAGNSVADISESIAFNSNEAGKQMDLALEVTDLQLWSAETPNLYTVVFSQKDAKGKEEMAFATKYGFRNIAVNDNQVFINGKRIYFRGVNTQDTHPLYGRSIDVETMLKDIRLMKQGNVNTVRTSHYPRQPKMMAMFDYYGLYVMDEADVECHKNWQDFGINGSGINNTESWKAQILDRTNRMVYRDRNHPSVIFWSLGNESGCGQNLKASYNSVKSLDSRLVHYEGATNDGASYTDICSIMYPSLSTVSSRVKGNQPFFMCEYAHAMGNAVGNLQEYWDLIEGSSCGIGGCIWDWVDQAIYDPKSIASGELTKKGFNNYITGYDKPGPHQGNFVNNGIITADRQWTAKLTEVKKVYQPVKMTYSNGWLKITNKNAFTNLGDLYELYYASVKDGVVTEEGTMEVPSTAPGAMRTLAVPCSGEFLNVELRLKETTLWAEKGYAQCTEQFAVKDQGAKLNTVVCTEELTISDDGNGYTLESGKVLLTIGTDGFLDTFISNGVNMLAKTNAIDQPIYSNVRWIENESPYGTDQFGNKQSEITLTTLTVPVLSKDHTTATFMATVADDQVPYTINYTLYGTGELDMDITYKPNNQSSYTLRRIGIDMKFPAGFEDVAYYAQGPEANYVDRQSGTYMGRYTTTVDGLFEGNHVRPQSHGNHMDLRELTLTNSSNSDVINVATSGQVSFSLSHYDQQNYLAEGLHPYDLNRQDEVFATFDYMQRGLGNGSCGPGTISKYECPISGSYRHTIRLWGSTQRELTKVEKIVLSSDATSIHEGGTLKIHATVTPDEVIYKGVRWSSSNEEVATVAGGVVTANSVGKATITATALDCSGVTASMEISVTKAAPIESIFLSCSEQRVEEGNILQIKATVMPENANMRAITWSSSDERIATVNEGLVTAVSAGDVKITARATDGSGVSATIDITVTAPSYEAYSTNFDKNVQATNSKRYITYLTLKANQGAEQKVTVAKSYDGKVYHDLTKDTLSCKPGAKLSTTIGYVGNWMHGYVFLDLDHDKRFSFNEGEMDQSGTEVMSFGFYSGSFSNDASGYNSAGAYITGNARDLGSPIVNPDFTAPQEVGFYYMRYKVDWNSIDPGGQLAADGTATGKNGIMSNGGGIVDVILKVGNPTTSINTPVALLPSNMIYDIQGRPVSSPITSPGIYVITTKKGNKKVLINP